MEKLEISEIPTKDLLCNVKFITVLNKITMLNTLEMGDSRLLENSLNDTDKFRFH